MSIQTTLKGNWHEFKGTLRERWGEITDDEMDQVNGQKEKFIGVVMKKYSLIEADARKAVDKVWSQYA